MKTGCLIWIGIALTATTAFSQHPVLDILSRGAVGDGQTSNTSIIQKAIDELYARGGGTVLVPAGKFMTGVIHLKSKVELHLDDGAFLMGSTKRADYGPGNASALIVANEQHHISITGHGTINGEAAALLKDIYSMLNAGTLQDAEWKTYNDWHQMRPSEQNRPKIIEFRNCDSIRIKGITIRDGLCWVQNYKECSNLIIDSISVESNTFLNNDGIDLVDCKNVQVTHSFINAADDGICLKSENRNSRCENIYISDCKVRSSASAVKFGTASWGGFKKVVIRNIEVYDTYRSAIAIECVDGGILEEVDIRNVKARNTGNAIFIRLGHRNKDSVISRLRHVYIADVRVEVPKNKPDSGYETEGPMLNYPHNVFPSSISGLPGHLPEDISLENIEIVYQGGASKERAYFSPDSLSEIKEATADYPEFSMFGELPVWGFYLRHASAVKMKNIKLRYKEYDFRAAVIADDVKDLQILGIDIPTAASLPVIVLHNVPRPVLKNIEIAADKKNAILIKTN